MKIDDINSTLTSKRLNPDEKENQQTIPVSEYLDSIKIYICLYDKCYLRHKEQNEFKDTPIFLYCI